jgi:hypothetical protein
VTKKRVTKLCVCDREAEREEEEKRRRSRIQNQEQEPHTKMWGKNLTCRLEFQKTSQPCASTYTFQAAQTLDSPA